MAYHLPAFALLSCCLHAPQLNAQYDDLMRNPKVSWVAEYKTEFELNPEYSNVLDTEYNLVELIRLSNVNQTNGLFADAGLNYSFYFSQHIYSGLAAGQFQCFADEALLQPLPAEQVKERLHRLDTVLADEAKFKALLTFRVRQVFFYNQSDRQFGARLLAIAPVVYAPDAEGAWHHQGPLLWIKSSEYDKKQRRMIRQNAAYVWQTRMKANAPRPEDLSVKKGQLDFRQWARSEAQSPSHRCLAYDTYQPLDRAALHALIFTTGIPTQVNADGVTPVQQPLRKDATEQVVRLRFVQHWYFDAQSAGLYCALAAVAPLAAVRGADGEIRYEKPLFYVKY